MNRDELRDALKFYADLGITDLYRSAAVPVSVRENQLQESSIQGISQEPLLPLAPPGDTLEKIQLDIGPDCRRCRLCEQRSKIVFGVGSPQARLVFVGEGPGADEDAQGIPFVGRAGQLLTQHATS